MTDDGETMVIFVQVAPSARTFSAISRRSVLRVTLASVEITCSAGKIIIRNRWIDSGTKSVDASKSNYEHETER